MFKWPNPPVSWHGDNELADWVELNCLANKSVAKTELSQLLGRLEENENSEGVPEENQIDTNIVDKTYMEIGRRQSVCQGGYPFHLDEQKATLTLCRDKKNAKQKIYIYLLLTTRLNMKERRSFSNIDATHLFEKLSEQVARNYFGERSESMLFSAQKGGQNFEQRVNILCGLLKEGGEFRNRDAAQPKAKDDKLDIVVWKSFADDLPSKLIGFGQCKTETSYPDSISELQPDAFCKKWMSIQPTIAPVRMFFVAESLSIATWNKRALDAGLLLDRCRIIDYGHNISNDVLLEIETWSRAATEEELSSTLN